MGRAHRAPEGSSLTELQLGLVGHPVEHSRSPALHRAALAAVGLRGSYVAIDVAPGELGSALEAAFERGITGLSVTMPHKQAVAMLVSRASPLVERLAACNTVSFDGRSSFGDNTDGQGVLAALQRDAGFAPQRCRAVVIGAGGVARAAIEALAGAGAAEIVVVNRTHEPALAAAALAPGVGRVGGIAAVASADLVVQATSLGMAGTPLATACPVPGHLLDGHQLVLDLVSVPKLTPLLALAASRGCAVLDGTTVLLHQAARQFELWTGLAAPLEAMRAALDAPA